MALDLCDVLRVSSGELRRLLRDTHTLIYSIALPLFLNPALFLGITQVLTVARGAAERRVVRVALLESGQAPLLAGHLRSQNKLEVAPWGAEAAEFSPEEASRRIGEGSLDAVLVVERDPGGEPRALIYASGARDASAAARARLERALDDFRREELRRKAEALGAGAELLDPLEVRSVNLRPREARLYHDLARVVPLLLLLMAAVGAFYPALDVTAGERERGTIETTLLAPVGRAELVLGKFLPVVAFALLAMVFQVASMGVALRFFLFQLDIDLPLSSLPAGGLAGACAGSVLLALLLSAVMVAAALFARSFKEGQTYLGPIMAMAMVPGIAATIPELGLTPLLATVPVLNLALALRDLLQGKLDPALGAAAFASAAVYTAAGLWLAARLASREAVLLGSPAAGWSLRGALAALLGAQGRT